MRIQYVANGMKRTVRDSVGKVLIARRIARAMEETPTVEAVPDVAPDVAPGQYARTDMQPVDPADDISPITGKTKRRYNRRDMQAKE